MFLSFSCAENSINYVLPFQRAELVIHKNDSEKIAAHHQEEVLNSSYTVYVYQSVFTRGTEYTQIYKVGSQWLSTESGVQGQMFFRR